MTFKPSPDCAKVVIHYLCQGQKFINILHFQNTNDFDTGDLGDLAEAIADSWVANIMPLLSNQISITEVDAVDLRTQSGPEAQHIVTPPVAGSLTSPMLPSNVAVVLTKRTAKRGRSYRGRIYIPGAVHSQESGPLEIGTTALANLISGLEAVLSDVDISPWVWGVLSFFLNKVARSQGVFEMGTAISADTLWDSQRRRLSGRGA